MYFFPGSKNLQKHKFLVRIIITNLIFINYFYYLKKIYVYCFILNTFCSVCIKSYKPQNRELKINSLEYSPEPAIYYKVPEISEICLLTVISRKYSWRNEPTGIIISAFFSLKIERKFQFEM